MNEVFRLAAQVGSAEMGQCQAAIGRGLKLRKAPCADVRVWLKLVRELAIQVSRPLIQA